jgi:hypothetical protein
MRPPFVLADVVAFEQILAAPEPETRWQRIGRLLRLPVTPAPVIVRGHHISAPRKRTERQQQRLAYEYAVDHVRHVLHKHYGDAESSAPMRKSRVRVPQIESDRSAHVLPMRGRM